MTAFPKRSLGPFCILVLMGALAGCANQRSTQSTHGSKPPPSHVQDSFGVLQGDYVFYPKYQVYHSPRQKHFVFLERGSWVTQSKPPGVSTEQLFASPAVRLGSGPPPTFQH